MALARVPARGFPLTVRTVAWTALVAGVVAAALIALSMRHVTALWWRMGIHPDVLSALELSLEDQRRLADVDPVDEEAYRARFEALQQLRNRLQVIEHSQEALLARYRWLFRGLLLTMAGTAGGALWWRQRRDDARLARLRGALAALAAGERAVETGIRDRDAIGRVAAMVAELSRAVALERRRMESLRNLEAWQEAARRHAHEMRTPLAAARLGIDRLSRYAAMTPAPGGDALEQIAHALRGELERLAGFARSMTAFARLPQPRRCRLELDAFAAEVVETFTGAWAGVRLARVAARAPVPVDADPALLRQAVVNLIDNAARAPRSGGRTGGVVSLRAGSANGSACLDLVDDGSGVPEEVRARLFQPYITTRPPGEGMGLGLSLARKVLLDHGGDLELVATGASGTTMRLILPWAGDGPEESP
jgi:two-component system, NtrC family, nitrogen regulation sensor histidine kinase NtrY